MMTDRDADTGSLNTEYYTYDSWGEHADAGETPSTENKIRYAGGRVEFFADGTDQGAVYLCGERHYMPMYGRFLQRDRLTYELLPSPSNPLGVNPYIYAENNPVMKKDINGQSPAGYYRGATMAGKTVILGTQMPPEAQIYDCCDKGYTSLSATDVSFSLIYSTRLPGSKKAGYIDFATLSKNAGWGGNLCDANPKEGQPNERCAETTTATSDLLCTYVEQCMGGSCPEKKHQPWKGTDSCHTGMASYDVGYDSDPGVEYLGDGLAIFTDSFGTSVVIPESAAYAMEAYILPAYFDWYDNHLANNYFYGNPGWWYRACGNERLPYIECAVIAEILKYKIEDDFHSDQWSEQWKYGYTSHFWRLPYKWSYQGRMYGGQNPPWNDYVAGADNYIGFYLPDNRDWYIIFDPYLNFRNVEIVYYTPPLITNPIGGSQLGISGEGCVN